MEDSKRANANEVGRYVRARLSALKLLSFDEKRSLPAVQ